MRRKAPSASTCAMNSRRSSYSVIEPERLIDHGSRPLEVVGTEHVHLHEERGAAVKLLVLLVPVAELAADEVPGEPHERDALARADRGGLEVAFNVGPRLRVVEVLARRGQRDHAGPGELAHDV